MPIDDTPLYVTEDAPSEEGEDALAPTEDAPADPAPEETRPASREQSVYQADARADLEDRVTALMRHTSLYEGGTVHYEALADAPTVWDVPYVLMRFDELSAVYFRAMLAMTPKAKGARLEESVAKIEGETIDIRMTVAFEVTNKLVRLMLGSGTQTVRVHLSVARAGDGFCVRSMQLEGDKKYSDTAIRLGSDVLFGTEDYVGYADDLMRRVTASLGRVHSVSATRYGVVFQTATAT